MTDLEEKLKKLEEKCREIERLICQKNLETILQKIEKEDGWALFKFFSSYGGDDLNKHNIETYYLFSPHIAKKVKKRFKNAKFSHGIPGNNCWKNPKYHEFDRFLSKIKWGWPSYFRVMSPDQFDVDYIECDRKQFDFFKQKGIPVINE